MHFFLSHSNEKRFILAFCSFLNIMISSGSLRARALGCGNRGECWAGVGGKHDSEIREGRTHKLFGLSFP